MAFRIGEHVRFLKSVELGWWDEINKKAGDGSKDKTNHYLTLMSEAEGLPKETFKFESRFKPKEPLRRRMILQRRRDFR